VRLKKYNVLPTIIPEYEIFESLLWNNGFLFERDHFDRLKRSARYFSYPYENKKLQTLLTTLKIKLCGSLPQKVRVFIDNKGTFRWDASPAGKPTFSEPVPTVLTVNPIDEKNPFLFNKTTYKPWYKNDAKIIGQGTCFDVIHINSLGNVSEGSRSNVFMKKGDMLYTPPVECGLLPGVLRNSLLRRGKCREALLTPNDLKKADIVYCGNSVRGLVRVKIIDSVF
jgi:para-aminobenzoate synthetase / 4-amino-4-deoxychorismate lyase